MAPDPPLPVPAVRPPESERDSWAGLAAHTEARIALGRSGASLRTRSLLEFKVAHALARDAVRAVFAVDAVEAELRAQGLEVERLATRAPDRATYLTRPDLGRELDPASAERLRSLGAATPARDLVILVSDGLSATAAGAQAAATAGELARLLQAQGWALYPVFVVPFARVKLQDQVGGILGARHSLILLGERPGLSAADSLGAYLTFGPRPDRTDADRNCVSNIRAAGLPPAAAARKLAGILLESRRLGYSGARLRDLGP